MKRLIIAVDFDGCIVEDKYPAIGAPKPFAISVLNQWLRDGHSIIINSCRVGDREKEIREFIYNSDIMPIVPYGKLSVNMNISEKIDLYGSDTRKISADVYIDDKNIFCHEINWLKIADEISRLAMEVMP